jgi:hypothetical protein
MFAAVFFRRGLRVRHRQQVVGIGAVHAAPAKVVGEPRRLRALRERLEAAEMLLVRAVGRAEIQGDAVLHDAVLGEDPVEHLEWATAIDHEILGDDLEPVDRGLPAQDVVVVRDAQADADAVVGVAVEWVGGHGTKGAVCDRRTALMERSYKECSMQERETGRGALPPV